MTKAKPIREIPAGTRVRDRRYTRIGTVHREVFAEPVGNPVHRYMPECEHMGVLWDGGVGAIIGYPGDYILEVVTAD